MNLYLISQSENNGYDTYDSAVVAAPDENTARNMNPGTGDPMTQEDWEYEYSNWCSSPDKVDVQLLGICKKDEDPYSEEDKPEETPRVICASFHAG